MRRALLLGVGAYQSADFRDLPCVPRDLERMAEALEGSGYAITRPEHDLGQNALTDEIEDFIGAGAPGETLLIYFTGHGHIHDGRSYLVPADARRARGARRMIDTDLWPLIGESRAALIVLVIDACRDPLDPAKGMPGWGPLPARSDGPRFVRLFGCDRDQVCHFVPADDPHPAFSLFTEALALALDPANKARTLREVIAETRRHLADLAETHRKPAQRIKWDGEDGADQPLLSTVLCDGPAERALRDIDDPWIAAALQSPLWARTSGTAEEVDAARAALHPLLTACRDTCAAADPGEPDDPWRDPGFIPRTIAHLEALLIQTDTAVTLTPTELTCALLAPFAREAALRHTAPLMRPTDFESTPGAPRPRAAFQQQLTLNPRLERQGRRLTARDAADDARAVGLLLAFRAATRSALTWRPPPDGWFPPALWATLRGAAGLRDPGHLLTLARCVGASPADRHAGTLDGVRLRLLGALLSTASALAIDARTLSDVVIDHVGLTDPVSLADLRARLSALRWHIDPADRAWKAEVECHHPAESAGLLEHVHATRDLLDHLRATLPAADLDADDLRWLPARIDHAIRPAAPSHGPPAFRTPHVRFHLDPGRVRELLMGTELYGEPALALRELYQNAIDACRYRERRRAFLQHTNSAVPDPEWSPQIAFEEGEDARGRYIDCVDNGVGMDWPLLTEVYACAGRRFAETPEFIDEHADWLRADPSLELHPNSQFGIGVLSVFMLADEVHVSTRRFERSGKLGEPLHVRIAGSGSLFRVVEPCPVDLPDAGTRVRLYVSRPLTYEGEEIGLGALMRRLVWRPVYPLRVGDDVAPAGVLRTPWPATVWPTSRGDVWWVPDYSVSGRLYDGVFVESSHYDSPILIDHAPGSGLRLRADRRGFADETWSWWGGLLSELDFRDLLPHQPLEARYLWRLAEAASPRDRERLARTLIDAGARITRDGDEWSADGWGVNHPRYADDSDWLRLAFAAREQWGSLRLDFDELGVYGLYRLPTTRLDLVWAGLCSTPVVQTWIEATHPRPPESATDLLDYAAHAPQTAARDLRSAARTCRPCVPADLLPLALQKRGGLFQTWTRLHQLTALGIAPPSAEAMNKVPRWVHLSVLLAHPEGVETLPERLEATRAAAHDAGLDPPPLTPEDLNGVRADLELERLVDVLLGHARRLALEPLPSSFSWSAIRDDPELRFTDATWALIRPRAADLAPFGLVITD